MQLRNTDYTSLVKKVKENNSRIIVYGAGMIGQIIVPYLVRKYNLYSHIDCFIDTDKRKKGQKIYIDNYIYEIKNTDYLEENKDNQIILITNSKYSKVLEFLDNIQTLESTDGYIVPIMQLHEIEENNNCIIIEKKYKTQLIPKKIHYCWFGKKEMPQFLCSCINSWREKCPDYEIIEWNEDNYDINRHEFTKEAYTNGKYGFVTDVARLDILYENGGIYLDTDVTLLKNLDNCLYQEGFIGTEKWGNINSGGGCGFMKEQAMLKKLIDYRENFQFMMSDGSLNIETNGVYESKPFLDAGFRPDNTLQEIEGVTIYPSYVNHPYDYMSCETHLRNATMSVHHFFGGWMEEEDRKNRRKTQEEYKCIINRIEKTESELYGR
ncbi:glycosyltransferase [Suilimivivens sp.]|jgi:hypothetical protein|uniref:glycosyltransferase n=1 Tax=Suilimivivens sp. TaxID=2981669 RepID=UPI0019CB7D56